MDKFENGDIVSVDRDVTIMSINSDERYVITPDMRLTVVVPFKDYGGIEACLVDVGKFATPMLEDNLVLVEKHSDERPATEDAPTDGRDKVLYRITNRLGGFYVVSRTLDEAAELLQNRLDQADYGLSSEREVRSIEVIATEHFFNGKQSFTGDYERLIVK